MPRDFGQHPYHQIGLFLNKLPRCRFTGYLNPAAASQIKILFGRQAFGRIGIAENHFVVVSNLVGNTEHGVGTAAVDAQGAAYPCGIRFSLAQKGCAKGIAPVCQYLYRNLGRRHIGTVGQGGNPFQSTNQWRRCGKDRFDLDGVAYTAMTRLARQIAPAAACGTA